MHMCSVENGTGFWCLCAGDSTGVTFRQYFKYLCMGIVSNTINSDWRKKSPFLHLPVTFDVLVTHVRSAPVTSEKGFSDDDIGTAAVMPPLSPQTWLLRY